jgi:hypothetical protein
MTYIPHTESDRRAMLETIGVDSIEAHFWRGFRSSTASHTWICPARSVKRK